MIRKLSIKMVMLHIHVHNIFNAPLTQMVSTAFAAIQIIAMVLHYQQLFQRDYCFQFQF